MSDYTTSDPYPWLTVGEDGKEFRYHTAHEDGIDSHGVEWSGWTYAPRSEGVSNDDRFDTTTSDPYPWVTIGEDGEEFRAHTAHEDGIDEHGVQWSGWTYSPRS